MPGIINPYRFSGGSSTPVWLNRVKITIASAEVDSDLTDFPVYVRLSDMPSGFFTNVDSAGDDIRVTKSDGSTEVPFELVTMTVGSSVGELHFKADSLSSSTDTDFYIYYNNTAASAYATNATYGRNNVWTNNFAGVYHCQDSSTSATDSTGVNALGSGTFPSTGSGKLEGQAFSWNGSTHGLYTTSDIIGGFPVTMECWVNFNDASGPEAFMGIGRSGNLYDVELINRSAANKLQAATGYFAYGTGAVSPSTYTTTGTWYYVAGVLQYASGPYQEIYVDGVSVATSIAARYTWGPLMDRTSIGHIRRVSNLQYMNGLTDEHRFSTVVRSADWIAACYSNQNTPATFYTTGSEETGTWTL